MVLTQACKLQKSYGQTEAELESLVEGFSGCMPDYPMANIIEAINQYIRKHPDIPRPSDIENIINPPRPKPDWAVFVDLKKRIHEGYFPLSTERKFLRDCEAYAMDRMNREGEAYAEAQRQIESHRLALECHD